MTKTFTLLKVDEGIYESDLELNSQSAGITEDNQWSVRMQRLQGGLSDGIDVVWLDNGCTRLAVLPTRGMGIWKAETAGVPLEWKSPVERPVHPTFVDQMRRGGIGWLDGFNELLCRCGLGWHGAPGTDTVRDESGDVVSEQFLPLHGRIANLSAHEVTVEISEDGTISLIGSVDEASVFGGRLRLTSVLTTRIGSNTFEIRDTVTNLGSAAAETEMLYHCNIGRPFLEAGSRVHIPAVQVAPRDARAAEDTNTWTECRGPEPGYAEQVYFTQPIAGDDNRSVAVLTNEANDKAVVIRFDTSTLPWMAVWKNTQADEDGYCIGLEPAGSFPNLKTFEREQGRVTVLESGQSVTYDLSVTVVLTSDDAAAAVTEVSKLQGDTELTLHAQPKPDWSA